MLFRLLALYVTPCLLCWADQQFSGPNSGLKTPSRRNTCVDDLHCFTVSDMNENQLPVPLLDLDLSDCIPCAPLYVSNGHHQIGYRAVTVLALPFLPFTKSFPPERQVLGTNASTGAEVFLRGPIGKQSDTWDAAPTWALRRSLSGMRTQAARHSGFPFVGRGPSVTVEGPCAIRMVLLHPTS
jgi:hypothetical protein